jgi:DNA processing protein
MDWEVEKQAKSEYAYIEKHKIKVSFFDQPDYPVRMYHCAGYPNLFFYKGESIFQKEKMISIVGTRNITPYGTDVVQKIISELAVCDPVIVSGLALGVDTLAHEAALQNGLKTIGIMGSGFGRIYPSSNHKLVQKMLETGNAVISEYPYNTLPDKTNFPKRNRLIASISDATVVIETKMKGGSIITVNMASMYKRDIFAVPGSIFETSQEGCNMLIQSGTAKMVLSGHDIIEKMRWNSGSPKIIQPKLFFDLSVEEEFIYNIIRKVDQISIDEIQSKGVGYTPSQIASYLLQLEFQGLIECRPGKLYRCIRR